MNNVSRHTPVLLKEIIELLNPQPNENFIDCTLGGAGHALAILEKTAPRGKVLGIDASDESLRIVSSYIKGRDLETRLILVRDNFVNLRRIVEENNFCEVDGILFDLGLSTDLLESSGRGFSFLCDEKLDMRFDDRADIPTAVDLINGLKQEQLADIFYRYGEERRSRRIAEAIVLARRKQRINTTGELSEIVKRAISGRGKINPATKVFQALRIAVNHELDNLSSAIDQSIGILNKNGRLAIISYHSLEDRIVKNKFKNNESLKIINKKPIISSREEILINRRARSAKLRVVEKI